MTTQEIIQKISSRNTQNIREAACEIIALGQNREKIAPLIEHLNIIKSNTRNLDLGGMFAPNQRFVDFAIKTIEFHKNTNDCSCLLYIEKYILTNDIVNRKLQYDCFNPNNEDKKGNIKILEINRIDNKWIDYYLVECQKCLRKYEVEEREGHYVFWNWRKSD